MPGSPKADTSWLDAAPTVRVEPGRLEAALRGAGQGATLGFSDELAGAYGTASSAPADWLYERLNPEEKKAPGAGQQYLDARDQSRIANMRAERAHPNYYLGGQLVGGVAPAAGVLALTGGSGAPALLGAAGQGAAQGAGYSDAATAKGTVADSTLGGVAGLAAYGAGSALRAGGQKVAGWASRKASSAAERALSQAEKEVADQIKSAQGSYGREVQQGSRYVENLLRLRPDMTAEQQARMSALTAAGVIPGLEQKVAQSTLEALPSQAGTIAAKQAEYAALSTGADAATAARFRDLLATKFKEDAKTYAKAYAEPLVAAAVAYQAADAVGMSDRQKAAAATTAGMVFGRTRAGKALYSRLTRPGNQYALATALRATVPPTMEGAGRYAIPASVPAVLSSANQDPIVQALRREIEPDELAQILAQKGK